jgi:mono/diheme cytochrome c family protein
MKRILALAVLTAFPLTATADDATALYKAKCAMCHGATGAGDTPIGKKLAIKALSSPDVQKNSDAQLLQVITNGKGKMPAFGTKLSADQIKQLVAVVRTFAKKS